MKCASAKAGIASVMAGWAVALSGAPAHATFIYLNQSQSISATGSAGSTASSSGGSRVYAGLQQRAADVHGSDAGSSGAASYSTSRWTSFHSAARADNRSDSSASAAVATGSSAANSPAKDSSTGVSGPSTSNEAGSPPLHSTPIGSSPTVITPIVIGVPTKTVPEPSTVGLLGIGLLLACITIRRGKRARDYSNVNGSNVSGSPRSSRRTGNLARALTQNQV